jgi:hypothetical protein
MQKERAFRKDINNSNWQRKEMSLTLGYKCPANHPLQSD